MTEAQDPRDAMDASNGAMLVIISGPSGVGKDTIIDALKLRPHLHIRCVKGDGGTNKGGEHKGESHGSSA